MDAIGREAVRRAGWAEGVGLRRGLVAAAVLGALSSAAPGRASAQESALTRRCAAAGAPEDTRRFCNLVAQAIEVIQPRLGLAPSGGNPVPGTASTLGMRIGRTPRLSLAGRVTGVWADLPPIRRRGTAADIDFVLPSLNVDGAVGLFGGFSPAPTVGGVASLDGLASIGLLPVPGDEGFIDETLFSWALGVRLGILRESFTLPGLSISALYRRLGDVTFGDPGLDATDAFFDMDLSMIGLRGAASKRIFLFGVTAGVGYDHYSSDVVFGVADPTGIGPPELRFAVDGFENDRWSAFANLSWTALVLHVVGELGWQSGGDVVPAARPPGIDFDPEDGTFFGSLAIRLSI